MRRVTVIRIDSRRRRRIARRMHALGQPAFHICGVLGLTRKRLALILESHDLWGAELSALMRDEARRAA